MGSGFLLTGSPEARCKHPMVKTAVRRCKDCVAEGVKTLRAAPHPGPRCATHHRGARKASKRRSADLRVVRVYGLTPEQFAALWEAQGRRCAICRRSVKIRRPQVDHDHDTGEVRGLLCRACNYDLLGHYNVDALIRAARYLLAPPAFEVIGHVIVPRSNSLTRP